MPSKKKKYNARFPAGRIKKIMQSDEEIGKVAQAVPVIISRTLELFVESLLTKTLSITNSRNAKTLSTSHMKQCIMSEQRFDFLRDLVKAIPDISVAEEAPNYNEEDAQSSPEENYPDSDTPYDLSMPSTSTKAAAAAAAATAVKHTSAANGTDDCSRNCSSQQRQNSLDRLERRQLKRKECADGSRRSSHLGTSSSSSVTMHSASAAEHAPPPPKLLRSESTSSASLHQQQSNNSWLLTTATQGTTTAANQQLQRQRLKHQSQSLPSGANNNGNSRTVPQQEQQQIQLQPTAIPAPIVSFDFCNKPIVKIDYSNLALSMQSQLNSAPLSAPPNIASEPVFNIDLTNIVTNPLLSTKTTTIPTAAGAAADVAPTAIATISIGDISPVVVAATSPLTNSINPKASVGATLPPSSPLSSSSSSSSSSLLDTNNSSNSKSSKRSTLVATVTIPSIPKMDKPAAAATLASNKRSFFELDEDYDNI